MVLNNLKHKKYVLEIGIFILILLLAYVPYFSIALFIIFLLSYPDSRSIIFGSLIGGFIGYLLRPVSTYYDQLPFEIVITRGEQLKDFDRLLIPMAQLSFNYIVAGAILGAFIGWVTYKLIIRK